MRSIRKRLRVLVIANAAALATLIAGPIAIAQTRQQEAPVASSKLNLTMEQRFIIKEIVKGLKVESEPRDLNVDVGQTVPKSMQLRAMPRDISSKVSQVRSHLYFVKNDKVVLVDPKDNKIVDVIEMK